MSDTPEHPADETTDAEEPSFLDQFHKWAVDVERRLEALEGREDG